jgi:hypothetical protein
MAAGKSTRKLVRLTRAALTKAIHRTRYEDRLFAGDDALFKRLAGSVQVYGEYGVGRSTVWMFENTSATILGVDTSVAWITEVVGQVGRDPRVDLRWVDVGDVAEWGRPTSFAKRANFEAYANSPWDREAEPEVVLIDGRFRVACFLTSLLRARSGTKIIFDDYRPRQNYHVVEECLAPVEFCGRQALFIVPATIDRSAVESMRDLFLYVVD